MRWATARRSRETVGIVAPRKCQKSNPPAPPHAPPPTLKRDEVERERGGGREIRQRRRGTSTSRCPFLTPRRKLRRLEKWRTSGGRRSEATATFCGGALPADSACPQIAPVNATSWLAGRSTLHHRSCIYVIMAGRFTLIVSDGTALLLLASLFTAEGGEEQGSWRRLYRQRLDLPLALGEAADAGTTTATI